MHRRTRPGLALYAPLEPRRLCFVDLAVVPPGLGGNVAGEALDIRVFAVIRNDGTSGTGSSVPYRVVLSTSSDLEEDVVTLGTGTVPAIDANARDGSIERDFSAPMSFVNQTLFVGVIVDPDDAIAEIDEANNQATAGAMITIAPTFVGTTLTGSQGDDSVLLRQTRSALVISTTTNGVSEVRVASVGDLTVLSVDCLDGDDLVRIDRDNRVMVPLIVNGGDGDDSVTSGEGDDVLSGGPGFDRLDGGAGRDRLVGGAQPDRLRGQNGQDTLSGNGGRDHLAGNQDADSLIGGAGDDELFDAGDGSVDTISGGAGDDDADADVSDLLASIELP